MYPYQSLTRFKSRKELTAEESLHRSSQIKNITFRKSQDVKFILFPLSLCSALPSDADKSRLLRRLDAMLPSALLFHFRRRQTIVQTTIFCLWLITMIFLSCVYCRGTLQQIRAKEQQIKTEKRCQKIMKLRFLFKLILLRVPFSLSQKGGNS